VEAGRGVRKSGRRRVATDPFQEGGPFVPGLGNHSHEGMLRITGGENRSGRGEVSLSCGVRAAFMKSGRLTLGNEEGDFSISSRGER